MMMGFDRVVTLQNLSELFAKPCSFLASTFVTLQPLRAIEVGRGEMGLGAREITLLNFGIL